MAALWVCVGPVAWAADPATTKPAAQASHVAKAPTHAPAQAPTHAPGELHAKLHAHPHPAALAAPTPITITEVLERSQRKRLDEMAQPATDAARAATVKASFDRLLSAMAVRAKLELRVVSGPLIAETLLGRIVVANQSLADLTEGERVFVLAHEIGHVVQDHWTRLGDVYRRHVPGNVVKEQTDAVAGALGRDASMASHEHELQADAFAITALERLRVDADSAMAVFLRQGMQHDTATHPGTRKRVAQLRMLMAAK